MSGHSHNDHIPMLLMSGGSTYCSEGSEVVLASLVPREDDDGPSLGAFRWALDLCQFIHRPRPADRGRFRRDLEKFYYLAGHQMRDAKKIGEAAQGIEPRQVLDAVSSFREVHIRIVQGDKVEDDTHAASASRKYRDVRVRARSHRRWFDE